MKHAFPPLLLLALHAGCSGPPPKPNIKVVDVVMTGDRYIPIGATARVVVDIPGELLEWKADGNKWSTSISTRDMKVCIVSSTLGEKFRHGMFQRDLPRGHAVPSAAPHIRIYTETYVHEEIPDVLHMTYRFNIHSKSVGSTQFFLQFKENPRVRIDLGP